MSDKEFWADLKAYKKEKFDNDRRNFLEKAIAEDDGQWIKHTEYHWARIVAGKRLDYWPSRSKFQYDGKVQRGNVMKFIKTIKAAAPI